MRTHLTTGWLALAAGTYALAAERFLFESFPSQLAWLGWPLPAALGAIAAGLSAAGLIRAKVRRSPHRERLASTASAATTLLLPLLAALSPDVNLLRAQTLLLGSGLAFVVLSLFDWPMVAAARQSPALARGVERFGPPALVGLIALALYLRTLAPTVGEADTFEFQVAVARMGIAHPTGYPLFILLGKVFSWLPVGGTLAYRVNLASAAFGAVAAVLGYAIALRLGPDRIMAAITGILVGVAPTLWSRAVEAEVYTLHAAIVAAVLLLLLRLGGDEGRKTTNERRWPAFVHRPSSIVRHRSSVFGPSLLPLLGLLLGLGLSNHLTTILLVPAVGLSVAMVVWRSYRDGDRVPFRTCALSIAAFAAGLLVYLYIPLRWPAINDGEVMTWAMFRDYITGREPQGALHLTAFLHDPARYGILARKVVAEFGHGGAALALLGWLWTLRRNASAAVVTLAAYLGLSFFPLSFYVPDPDFSAFLIAPHLIEAIWIGAGASGIVRLAADRRLEFVPSWLASGLARAAFLLLPLWLIWTAYPRVDQSDKWEMYRLGQLMLSQPLEDGAVVLADSQKIAPLFYLQVAEGLRPDLDIRVLPDEAAYRAALEEALATGRTVYLGRYLPGLAGWAHMRSVGPLVEVSLDAFAEPPSNAMPLNLKFGEALRLSGIQADGLRVEAGEAIPVTLYWQASQPADGNYLVRLRLADPTGEAAWESTPRVPAGGLNPTSAWSPGDFISDFHLVTLDPALTPGDYELQAGLFPPFSTSGLPTSGGGAWASVATVRVLPSDVSPRPSRLVRARFGEGLWLVGYDLPESVAPGTRVPLTLYWTGENVSEIRIDAGGSETVASLDPARWPSGQVIPTRHTLVAPKSGEAFEVRVAVSGEVARCGWFASEAHDCLLSRVRIQGEAVEDGVVNFGDRILLTGVRVETPEAPPGGQVEVSLRWRSLRAMAENYTAFVHLIGPDGLVHGQVDAWPVGGTHATSAWEPGQSVDDRYAVPVPTDAPPGDYRVEIGWYLLATLDRLPVLGPDGLPVDDRVLVSGVKIRSP